MSYGFAIKDNPNDTYLLLLAFGSESSEESNCTQSIGPFMISIQEPHIPPALWKAIADPIAFAAAEQKEVDDLDEETEEESDALEVDADDAEFLLETLRSRHSLVVSHELNAIDSLKQLRKASSTSSGDDPRWGFVEYYFEGQKGVLAAAMASLEASLGY
mmetsp:Transcript_72018/g.123767  ORF Transcript_72018/g.123767 Transcript_72018/m.123767 type:complete len:160 (+) Transcript_72018:507-986(+)